MIGGKEFVDRELGAEYGEYKKKRDVKGLALGYVIE